MPALRRVSDLRVVAQVAGDGCSASCACESDPCDYTVTSSVNLASVVSTLRPGATLSLAGGTYSGDGACGWSFASLLNRTDERAITVRSALRAQGTSLSTIIDCDNAGPVVEGTLVGRVSSNIVSAPCDSAPA